ncbi:hypothetical protein M6B38_364175 [Iris pallida]|nr:hypothetical protein M6B38_364175 [Iris pallida]
MCYPSRSHMLVVFLNIVHMSGSLYFMFRIHFMYFTFLYFLNLLFMYFIFTCSFVLIFHILMFYLELYFVPLLTGYVAGILWDHVHLYGPEPGILTEQDGV